MTVGSSSAVAKAAATQQQQDEKPLIIEAIRSFDDMNLDEQLLRGVFAYGFEKPSVIQQKAIVPFASGRDIIAQAQSGTGKTGTYSIGMLQRVDCTKREFQALILVPTRELAWQVQRIVQTIGDYKEVICHAFIGGTRIAEDIERLKSGVHVIVGTPGRIEDMIRRRVLDVSALKILIFDEADEMLSVGFEQSVKYITQHVPLSAQVGIFSATMPPEMLEITKTIVQNPIEIIVKREELSLLGIRQFYVDVGKDDWKLDTLCDLYTQVSINQSVIFCNRKEKVNWLCDQMKDRGFPVAATHSEKEDRTGIMDQFRNGTIRVLITTDLLARGIDVQQVSVVINYDVPNNKETYLHRIGRSGRFGRRGVAINFVTRRDYNAVRELEQHYHTKIEELPANIADFIS